jgi:hypothetical protein
MPGASAPAEDEVEGPARPKAQTAGSGDAATDPRPSTEEEAVTPTREPAPVLGEVPEVEPPQPEITGPAAEPDGEASGASGPRRGAPPRGPGTVSEIPGEFDDDRPRLRIPPPARPPYSGVGLFVGASVTFATALTQQIVAHVLVKRRCIDPISSESFDDLEDDGDALGRVVLECIPGVVPAIPLRVQSDFALLATIGLAAGGAILRGRRLAHDHAFGDGAARDFRGLRWGGIGLIGLGVVTWVTTGSASWAMLASCDSGRCAATARALNFSMRSVSAVFIASGAGMLGFAEAYRRNHQSFLRDRAFSLFPTVGPQRVGIGMTGSF